MKILIEILGVFFLILKDMLDNKKTGTYCGTPSFMAPEILNFQKYGTSVDWYNRMTQKETKL